MNELDNKPRLYLMVKVVIITTIIACMGGAEVLEYKISGYAWVISLITAIVIIIEKGPGRISFPLSIWSPWIFIAVLYLIASFPSNALQRSIMLVCPIVVGAAVSTYRPDNEDLRKFLTACNYLSIAVIIIVIIRTNLILNLRLPGATGLAPEVMTASLLCSVYATRYVCEDKKYIFWWLLLALVPVIALTRMGIVVSGLTIVLTLAPLKFSKRVTIMALIFALLIGIFFTKRMQHKMFYSGGGTISNLSLKNPDLATFGRVNIWFSMISEINKSPILGHGANSSQQFVENIGPVGHPHNDWLRLLFEYGYLGTGIFILCLLRQIGNALNLVKGSDREARILFYAGASSVISLCLFMFTDNIILYAAFFGNMQFTILGLAYASYATKRDEGVRPI